jgi:multidrug efflux system membrane fusion protein
VIRLPRWAVSFENTVHVSVESRLKTVPVEVERVQGEEAFVSGGLNAGDVVVVTRLIDPLENSLLELSFAEEEESGP